MLNLSLIMKRVCLTFACAVVTACYGLPNDLPRELADQEVVWFTANGATMKDLRQKIIELAEANNFLCEENIGYRRENGYRCYYQEDEIRASYVMGVCEIEQARLNRAFCNMHIRRSQRQSSFIVTRLDARSLGETYENMLRQSGFTIERYQGKFNGVFVSNPIIKPVP